MALRDVSQLRAGLVAVAGKRTCRGGDHRAHATLMTLAV
jgi:hypothetical protein